MKQITFKSVFMRTVAVMLLTLGTVSVSAQYFMNVVQKDGKIVQYSVSDIDNVFFSGQEGPVTNYSYVDLGLSALWATFNVGATKPEEYGDYYAWGETETKEVYDWSSYKWCNGSGRALIKYCHNSEWNDNGFTDTKTILLPEDDVAHVKWGGSWRMPTKVERDELITNCTWTWTTMNGVNGYRVTSNKSGYTDRSIFLPAAGYRDGTDLDGVGYYGTYWSSSLNTGGPDFGDDFPSIAQCIYFYSSGVIKGGDGRMKGLSVRPVMTNPSKFEYVDLGLSVKWAAYNVGATKPEEYGDYYAWGEIETKTDYSWSTYKFRGSGSAWTNVHFSKYNTSSTSYGTVDNKTTLDVADDVAHVKWGGKWRMPTKAERDELRTNCTWTWTTMNGVKGYRVTSKKSGYTDRSIFLPAAGCRDGTSLGNVGGNGYYWSSSLITHSAYGLNFSSDYVLTDSYYRKCGFSVRPVCP